MIPIDFSWFALLYIGTGLVFIFGLWLYYDIRDSRFYEGAQHQVTYHCIRCERIYMTRVTKGVSACPDCGFENARLKF